MEFGVVLQTNPPAWRVVELAKQAELLGFTHVWTFDSHLLWQEPFVIYSQILAPDPHARRSGRWSPTRPRGTGRSRRRCSPRSTRCSATARSAASAGATRRCGSPTARRPRWPRCATPIHVIRELANGREVDYKDSELRFPWGPTSRLEVWVAAYGPKALALTGEVGDGFILQLADPDITAWSIKAVREAAERAGPRSRRR